MRSSLHEVRIERLVNVGRVDIVPGFFAITRSPQLREMLARVLDLGAVVTAAVHRSLLIGYAADLPFLPIVLEHGEWKRRWQLLPDARELGGIEVARPFRGAGIARLLLEQMVSGPRLDREILIGEGLHWHWDLAARGLDVRQCRARLLALFSAAGFCSHQTDEPEVSSSPWNFLIARIGSRIPPDSRRAFEAALLAGARP
jgi:acetoin utilization protein AcuA